jgi:hypothetical protein
MQKFIMGNTSKEDINGYISLIKRGRIIRAECLINHSYGNHSRVC